MSAANYLYALQSRVRRAALPLDVAHALGELAFTEMRMGYVEQANIKLANIAQLADAENSPKLKALHAYLLGAFDVYAGRTTAALSQLLSAQHLARLAADNVIEARALAVLCMSLATVGAFGEAFEAGDNALLVATNANDDRAICTASIALCNLYVDRGDAANALLQLEKAAPSLLRLGDPFTQISADVSRLPALLLQARTQSDLVPALVEACTRAAQMAEAAQHLKGLAHGLIALSHAYQLAGEIERAITTIDRAIAVCEDANATDKLAPAYQAKAIFLMQLGRYPEASQILAQALNAAISADYLMVHEEIAALQVRCCEKIGNIAEAFAAAKSHTQILLKQRLAERANLAALRDAKLAFSDVQSQLTAAHEQAESLRAAHKQLMKNTATFKQFSFEDALTELKNRRHFDAHFPQLLVTHAHSNHPLCMAIIDIDAFKSINDKYGHVAGDNVLKGVAACLREASRELGAAAEICRLGGDEFVFFIPDVPLADAALACEKLRLNLIASPTGVQYGAALSIGVAQWNGAENHTQFLTRTDQKLFAAKHDGRNRVAS